MEVHAGPFSFIANQCLMIEVVADFSCIREGAAGLNLAKSPADEQLCSVPLNSS